MSGIYIPGMEMPKTCNICPFMKTNDDLDAEDYRYMYCDFPGIGEFVTDYEASRHPYCPLIEVPAEHGRLIDADKLWIKLDNGSNSSIGQAHSYYKFAKVWLDQAETIIPAEEE